MITKLLQSPGQALGMRLDCCICVGDDRHRPRKRRLPAFAAEVNNSQMTLLKGSQHPLGPDRRTMPAGCLPMSGSRA